MPALIQKYSGHVPRYTSYPTAVEFHKGISPENWREALREEFAAEPDKIRPASLYVHVPFCRTLCYFCACNKKISQDDSVVAPYISAAAKELSSISAETSKSLELEQVHWGGGTPNYLSPSATEELYGHCSENFLIPSGAEVSIEVDPRTSSTELLETYSRLGFNRISLGVQDFDPLVQRAINRVQSYESTRDVCMAARALGFSSLNIDLIYGLPNQNHKTFAKDS